MISAGDALTVRVLHADGQCFRSWVTQVVRITPDELVTLSAPGQVVHDVKGDWQSSHYLRGYYWFDRSYNLLEVYDSDGKFRELYLNVANPPTLQGNVLTWTDHELDISMLAGEAPRLVDEDEFAEATQRYSYSPGFVQQCIAVAAEALQVAARWVPAGLG